MIWTLHSTLHPLHELEISMKSARIVSFDSETMFGYADVLDASGEAIQEIVLFDFSLGAIPRISGRLDVVLEPASNSKTGLATPNPHDTIVYVGGPGRMALIWTYADRMENMRYRRDKLSVEYRLIRVTKQDRRIFGRTTEWGLTARKLIESGIGPLSDVLQTDLNGGTYDHVLDDVECNSDVQFKLLILSPFSKRWYTHHLPSPVSRA